MAGSAVAVGGGVVARERVWAAREEGWDALRSALSSFATRRGLVSHHVVSGRSARFFGFLCLPACFGPFAVIPPGEDGPMIEIDRARRTAPAVANLRGRRAWTGSSGASCARWRWSPGRCASSPISSRSTPWVARRVRAHRAIYGATTAGWFARDARLPTPIGSRSDAVGSAPRAHLTETGAAWFDGRITGDHVRVRSTRPTRGSATRSPS